MKKHVKKFKVLYIILGVIAILLIGTVIAVTSTKNLGVKYSKADLKSVNAKLGVNYASLPDNSATSLKLEGQKSLNTQVTSEELTALLNQPSSQWKDYPVKDVQIKINDDGTVEMTGKILVKRFEDYSEVTNMPSRFKDLITENAKLVPVNPSFYYKGDYEVKDGKLQGEMTELKIGPLEVPKDWVKNNDDFITSFIDDRMHSAGLNVQSANFDGGKLNIQGTVPESIGFEE